jgi:hypothetical protein
VCCFGARGVSGGHGAASLASDSCAGKRAT